MKRAFFKNISLLLALVAVVYFVANYTEIGKNKVLELFNIPGSSVKGVSTERAQELSDKIGSDIGTQLATMQDHVLNVRVGDAVSVLSRVHKIPQDFHSIQLFVGEQVGTMLQSKQK